MSSKILRGPASDYPLHLWHRDAHAAAVQQAAGGPERAGGTEAASESWMKEMRARVEQARSEAFEEGRDAGLQASRMELQAPLERLAASLDELAQCRARFRKETEREIVSLALEVARRILRRELSVDPEAVLGLVRAALESVSLREVLEVRVHPTHAAAVRTFLHSTGAPEAIEIVPDAHLEPGSVLAETRRGGFDASAQSQLDEIGRGFADLMEREGR